MTNNVPEMGWVDGMLRTAYSVIQQMQSWPSSVLLFVVMTMLGVVFYSLAVVLHRFAVHVPEHQVKMERLSLTLRYLAPASVVIIASWLNTMLGDVGSVAPGQRNPQVILGMWGFCIGVGAWVASWIVYKKIGKRLPLQNGESTTFTEKPKEQ